MSTIKDIARETGLGLATISKYINGGTVREKNKIAIDAAIERLGYTVNEFARGLKTSRSRSIGAVIPDLGNVFISAIIKAAEDILRRHGYSVLICDCGGDPTQEGEAVRFLLQKRVDGILTMPVFREGVETALRQEVPVLLLDRMLSGLEGQVNAVLIDNVNAAADAVSSLIDHGHRRIGIILGPQDIFTSSQRQLGYSQAMITHSLQPEARFIVNTDYTVQGGYAAMRGLLKENPDMTAVFVTNYEMTLGAILAVNELSIPIPEQLSFIGFDNQQLSRIVRPPLTIVAQPLEEIGAAAAEILLAHLESGGKPVENRIVTLSTTIEKGDSVRRL